MPKRIDRANRRINATPERIYRALSDSSELVQWLPPEGMSGRMERYEFREGGGYRMTLTYDDPEGAPGKASANEDIVEVRFTEIEPNRRIVQVIDFESDDPTFAGAMTMTWTIAPIECAADVRIEAENVPEGITEADHAEGMQSSLSNLARFVE